MANYLTHIADSTKGYRPAMTNTFKITIPGLNGLVDKVSDREGAVISDDAEEVLRVSVEDFKEPTLTQGSIQMKRGNLTMEFPGAMEAFSSTSSFSCFIGADTYGKLYAWKCLAGDHETGDVGDPGDYWRTVTVEHLTGKGELIGTWTLNNCWCSSLEGATFDNNSPQVKKVSITLKYFKPQYRKATPVAAAGGGEG